MRPALNLGTKQRIGQSRRDGQSLAVPSSGPKIRPKTPFLVQVQAQVLVQDQGGADSFLQGKSSSTLELGRDADYSTYPQHSEDVGPGSMCTEYEIIFARNRQLTSLLPFLPRIFSRIVSSRLVSSHLYSILFYLFFVYILFPLDIRNGTR